MRGTRFIIIIAVLFSLSNFSCLGVAEQKIKANGQIPREQSQLVKILCLGDSYTKGESVKWGENWPMQLVTKLREQNLEVDNPLIVAKTGWTTSDLMKAIEETILVPPYDIVTLQIGVNDQFQGYSEDRYSPGFKKLLLKSIDLAGDRAHRVIVLSIPDYSITTFGKRLSPIKAREEIDSFNKINRRLANGNGVNYVDVTEISRKASGDVTLLAPDALHPSGKMYAEWVELIAPVARSSLGK